MIELLSAWLVAWVPWLIGCIAYYILWDIVVSAFRRGR